MNRAAMIAEALVCLAFGIGIFGLFLNLISRSDLTKLGGSTPMAMPTALAIVCISAAEYMWMRIRK